MIFMSTMYRGIVTMSCWLCLSCPLWAVRSYQPTVPDPIHEAWRWHTYTALDGNDIFCMAQGTDGSVWFGIDGGAVRYDGLDWQHYKSGPDSTGGVVVDFAVSPSGFVYAAGLDGGISVFDKDRWQRVFPEDPGQKLVLSNVELDQEGGLWASIRDGIIHWSQGTSTLHVLPHHNLSESQRLLFNHIVPIRFKGDREESNPRLGDLRRMHVGRQGTIVGVTQNRCLFYTSLANLATQTQWSWVRVPRDVAKTGLCRDLLQTEDSKVWTLFGAFGSSLGCFDPRTGQWEIHSMNQRFGVEEGYCSITQTSDGTLWVSAYRHLFRFCQGNWTMYRQEDIPIRHNPVMLLMAGADDSLWISGKHHEVVRLDMSQRRWKTLEGLIYQAEDQGGATWYISRTHRIVRCRQDQWHSYGPEDGLMQAPMALLIGPRGQVWVAGTDQGQAAIAHGRDGHWQLDRYPRFGWGIDPRAFYLDPKGQIWAGPGLYLDRDTQAKGGLLCYNTDPNGQWRSTYFEPQDGRQIKMHGIAQDSQGVLWLGGSLRRFHQGQFSRVSNPREFQDSDIDAIIPSRDGGIWAGSRFYGLHHFKTEGDPIHYHTDNALVSDAVTGLLEMTNGRLWVATSQDFSCFDGALWHNRLIHEDLTIQQEGGRLHEARDGSLWINHWRPQWKLMAHPVAGRGQGTDPGFRTIRYRPDRLAPETQFLNPSTQIAQPGDVLLRWQGRDPWNTTEPDKLEYAIRLDQGPWSGFSRDTERLLLDLAPGEHSFEVLSRDQDLNRDPTPARLVFTVLPPVWQQGWFLLLTGAMTAVIILLIVKLIRAHELRITKELALEKQQAIQQHEVDQARLSFFTNISHEFRTPLTLILGPLDRLIQEIRDPQQRRLLEMPRRNAQRLLRLVNELLDMRKVQEGRLRLETKEGDLVRSLREIVNDFSDAAQQNQQQLTVATTPDRLLCLFDADKLEKILFNLVSNALKFTSTGDQINVTLNTTAEWVIIRVRDNGPGIAAEHLPHVFDHFYRAYDSAEEADGTGIGLALTKELVDIHGGNISVQSPTEDGSGTCFEVRLPLKVSQRPVKSPVTPELPAETGDPSHEKPAEPQGTASRILLVEDNTDMREYIRGELDPAYEVHEVANGQEAWTIAKQTEFNLIISDVMMPEMDGFTLCTKLKQDPDTSHVPLILLTARGSENAQIEGLTCGADDYVTKPFSAPVLKARVLNLLNSRRLLYERFAQEVTMEPRELKMTTLDTELLEKALEIVETHMEDPEFDVDAFAKQMHMSRSTLYRKIRGITGQPVKGFLRIQRLKRAAQLLTEVGYNVSEASLRVGFLDRNYFSRAFKQQFGMSPSEYAEKHR